jgi:hypothetical protein
MCNTICPTQGTSSIDYAGATPGCEKRLCVIPVVERGAPEGSGRMGSWGREVGWIAEAGVAGSAVGWSLDTESSTQYV